MQYTNLGKSGLKVSRICLGMMTYGTSKWRDWVLDEEDSRPFITQSRTEIPMPQVVIGGAKLTLRVREVARDQLLGE